MIHALHGKAASWTALGRSDDRLNKGTRPVRRALLSLMESICFRCLGHLGSQDLDSNDHAGTRFSQLAMSELKDMQCNMGKRVSIIMHEISP
jgi:hypothetical protein